VRVVMTNAGAALLVRWDVTSTLVEKTGTSADKHCSVQVQGCDCAKAEAHPQKLCVVGGGGGL
jgi:hypothetical protein